MTRFQPQLMQPDHKISVLYIHVSYILRHLRPNHDDYENGKSLNASSRNLHVLPSEKNQAY